MKKVITFIILAVFSCNLAFAKTMFYEDFTFYGELVTDINLNKVDRQQEIQVLFPSSFNKKIPIILNGKAKFEKIGGKPMISLNLDELSIDARRHIPIEILVTAVNGKKLNEACFPDQNFYKTGFKNANKYTKEFAFFPINRFSAIPKVAKPSGNNFIMLLEPFYAFGGLILFAISPVTAPFCAGNDFCDIRKGSIIEFQFLKQISKQELDKVIGQEYL